MSSNMMTEVLNLQANQLNAGASASLEAVLNAPPEARAELSALMQLAARMKRWLIPVLPSSAYRARLRDGLQLAAGHQETHRALVETRPRVPQWGWLIGAAALGSAAGIIAMILRRRQTRKDASVAESAR